MEDEHDLFDLLFEPSVDHLLDNFKIIGHGKFIAGVPSDTPEFITKGIVASMLTYSLGNKSIDQNLKKYGNLWDLEKTNNPNDELLNEIFELVHIELQKIGKWVSDINDKPNVFGLVAANAALIRLRSTFRTAGFLIRFGYVFESAALCRMCLEQIAWAYRIHEINNSSALKKIKPSKCIKNLKQILPNSRYTYDYLNNFTHIRDFLVSKYLFIDNNDSLQVKLNFPDENVQWAWALLVLVDYYVVVYEYIYRNSQAQFSAIEKDGDGNFFPANNRQLLSILKKYQKKLSKNKSQTDSEEDD